MTSNLAVFDFDRTVVDDDSDSAVIRLLSEKILPPPWDNSASNWTPYMGNIFDQVHAAGFRKKDILARIASMVPVPGVIELITALHQHKWTIILLTDANSVFVEHWFRHHNLLDKVADIITNPAHFDSNEKLIIEPYTNQTTCERCPSNLCKKQALSNYMTGDKNFARVVYVGDGYNDFCPLTLLTENDTAYVRRNYSCARLIEKEKQKPNPEVRVPHFLWDDAHAILSNLFPVTNGNATHS